MGHLTRNERGTYDGTFKGKPVFMHALDRDRYLLGFGDPGGRQDKDSPHAYIERAFVADHLLDWLDRHDYEPPVKLRRARDGQHWQWHAYPLVPRVRSAQQGDSDFELTRAPFVIRFPRLGNARAFLNAVKGA